MSYLGWISVVFRVVGRDSAFIAIESVRKELAWRHFAIQPLGCFFFGILQIILIVIKIFQNVHKTVMNDFSINKKIVVFFIWRHIDQFDTTIAVDWIDSFDTLILY